MRILHIADVHIRGLSRHDEYRIVFEKLINDCVDKSIDHVFVGGDIFHTKTTNISPEYIDLLRWWLTEMANVCPVHLTLGNHDGNEANLSRQDAVSPIIRALDNPKIHLYKSSGTYEFADGWNWCVFSIFDKENWDKVQPKKNAVNIACYHGPVKGAKTETGWEVEGEINVSFFEKYDFCFLGDIHMMQFLDSREYELIVTENDLKKIHDYEIIEEMS